MIKKTNNFYTVENGKIIYEGKLPGDAVPGDSGDYHIAIVKKGNSVIKLWKYTDGHFKDTLSAINLAEKNQGKEVIFTKYSGMKYEGRNLLQGISIMKHEKKVSKFKRDDFRPEDSTDEQLADDFRLLAAKYSTMKKGGKTEFESMDEVVKFTAKLLKEIYARGKQTFHPDNMTKSSLELLQKAARLVVDAELERADADLISSGEKKEIQTANKMNLGGPFILTDSDGQQYGIIRFNEAERKDDIYSYKIRDFIPFGAVQKKACDEEYFKSIDIIDSNFIAEFSEIAKHLDGTILELGCGTGRALKILKDSGKKAHGIDISPASQTICKGKDVETEIMNAEDIKYPDNSYQSVFSLHTLEYIDNIEKAIDESVRIARSKVIHIVNLGERTDPIHKHSFLKLDSIKKIFSRVKYAKSFRRISDNVAMVAINKSINISNNDLLSKLDDMVLVPDYICLVGGQVDKENANDIDYVYRDSGPNMAVELIMRNQAGELANKLHPIPNAQGPHGDYVGLYDLVAVRKDIFNITRVQKQQKVGNLEYKEGDEGIAVLQVHERGLSKDQVDFTKSFGVEPVKLTDKDIEILNGIKKAPWKKLAELNSDELQAIFNDIKTEDLSRDQRRVFAKVDPVSIHTDIRFQKLKPDEDDFFMGGEGFTPGNQYKENLFVTISKDPEGLSKEKILANFKVAQGGSGEIEVKGPLKWMKIGENKPEVLEPGEVGATKNDYARMTIIDKFKWKAGVQDDKFKEFIFDGKLLKGRWIFTLSKLREGEQWLIGRPADQEMKSETVEKKFNIIKRDEEKRLVYGIVYEPNKKDSEGDEATAEEIEKACHDFMIEYADARNSGLDLMHEDPLTTNDAVIVECYIQPADMTLGEQRIYKGSWMLVTKIFNDELWRMIKEGIINGYSMGGTAET